MYLSQTNHIHSAHLVPSIYVSDGPDSNIYGLEPNYGCCTANFPQGWPKFTSGLWMRSTADDGLVAVSYSPCNIATTLTDGSRVNIEVATNYPFEENVHMTVKNSRQFPLYLRIPQWVKPDGTSWVQVGNQKTTVTPGNFTVVKLGAGEHKIHLHFHMPFRVETGINKAAIVYRGYELLKKVTHLNFL